MTIRDLYAEIDLSLAATAASKNVIYGLGQHYTPAQYQFAQASDLHWIPCNLGLQIGGTPVGSFDYMVESVNKTVDAIVSELQQFERYLHGTNGMPSTDYICNDSPMQYSAANTSSTYLSTRNHPSCHSSSGYCSCQYHLPHN